MPPCTVSELSCDWARYPLARLAAVQVQDGTSAALAARMIISPDQSPRRYLLVESTQRPSAIQILVYRTVWRTGLSGGTKEERRRKDNEEEKKIPAEPLLAALPQIFSAS
jgi:hypothetical protein